MTEKRNRFLQVPMGTETIYIEEAFRHRQADQELWNLFTLWGYLPVETPVFDFFDIYQDLIPDEKDIYRLIDREGDLLMLRSDITLFLAKQMGLSLKDQDVPARICYSGTILRHQNREDISKNEFFQTGVELIGKADLDADLEILILLHSTFQILEIVRDHIGATSKPLHLFISTTILVVYLYTPCINNLARTLVPAIIPQTGTLISTKMLYQLITTHPVRLTTPTISLLFCHQFFHLPNSPFPNI